MKNSLRKGFNSHRGFNLLLCTLLLAITVNSCGDDDGEDPQTELEFKTEGFVFVGYTASETVVAKYLEELPIGGTLDFSTGVTDFQSFYPNSVYGHAMFMRRTDESAGFAKYVVNMDGEFQEIGTIPTVDATSFNLAVRDAEVGVFHDRANPDIINIFNPTTLEVTNTIDMSAGFVPDGQDQRYERFLFRGDDVFSAVRGNANGESFTSFVVHQANLSTNTFVGDTRREGDGFSRIQTYRTYGQFNVDDAGNFYIADGGNYDGTGLAAALNKIPAGSNEFDADYNFYPASVLNPANIFFPHFNSFGYIGGTKGIAKVNSDVPQEAIDIVLNAGGTQNLSQQQINQIFSILFSAETSYWCVLDLEAKTVTPIAGIPPSGAFAHGFFFEHNGEFYLPVPTDSEDAYYRFNPTTGAAGKAFVVTGADLNGAYNLAENN